MTYAERLLLKQHRRNEAVGSLHSGLPANVQPLVDRQRESYDSNFGGEFLLKFKVYI